jgi:hypothetical protein
MQKPRRQWEVPPRMAHGDDRCDEVSRILTRGGLLRRARRQKPLRAGVTPQTYRPFCCPPVNVMPRRRIRRSNVTASGFRGHGAERQTSRTRRDNAGPYRDRGRVRNPKWSHQGKHKGAPWPSCRDGRLERAELTNSIAIPALPGLALSMGGTMRPVFRCHQAKGCRCQTFPGAAFDPRNHAQVTAIDERSDARFIAGRRRA